MKSPIMLLCLAAIAAAMATTGPARAQTLPPIPGPGNITVDAGGGLPIIAAPNANTLDIDLNAAVTVINLASLHISSADSLNIHFEQASDIVLFKSPTTIEFDAGGHLTGDVLGAPGGNIWFYSPGGFDISKGANVSGGDFEFATGVSLNDLLFVSDPHPLAFLSAASTSVQSLNQVEGIPEPQSWALLILGFGAVGAFARRRRTALATG